EVVMTGRNPFPELIELADYVSEVCKRKHPKDKGIMARKGIER
ncbi:MAG: cob(I)yrinic acid a,c-diamide adenosyltransferase, partial [Phascolarctobacterium sp.]|nr:cob(I)yrinic acid a,c-diamide adenosyltransferase [Phascolarctobacterium sp.]